MPRRKKELTSIDDGSAGDVKRIKLLPPELDDHKVRVDWEDDGGKWRAYDDDSTRLIINALENNKTQILLSVDGVDFVIDVGKSVQKNKKTGLERLVRLCTGNSDTPDEYLVYEYEDEKKNWCGFPMLAQRLTDKVKADGETECPILIGKVKWKLNLTHNEMKNGRKVRRIRTEVADVLSPPENSGTRTRKSKTRKVESGKLAAAGDADRDVDVKVAVKNEAKKDGAIAVKSEPEEKVKSVIVKGKAPVDPECTSKIDTAHVYCEGSDVYDSMLNQTNLQNNNNKYYLCQLLEDDAAKRYSVWFRWGRVGKTGQSSLIPCGGDLDHAKNIFIQKFYDKTKNDWLGRHTFEKVAGKYDLLYMDYGTDEKEEKKIAKTKIKRKIPDSTLDSRVWDLINLICDVKSMEDAVMEMKYDSRKAPLGKLTTAQIKAGYSALKVIDECIRAGKTSGQHLLQACNDFYTRVPHDFGMQRPPLIQTREEVKLKLELLEALADIQIAMTMLKEDADSHDNPMDRHYKSLEVDIKPVEKTSDEFKMVNEYLQTTHAPTHKHYQMNLKEVFHCDKKIEMENFKDHGNRMLLWHGSRLSNWVGILKQGLRIAPPEAPVTGYMFGKGVYFADMSSKSVNYCYTTRTRNTGIILLCDVSLGKGRELLAADYQAQKLLAGYDSVKALGSMAPDPEGTVKWEDGIHVPKGKPKGTGINNPDGYTLNYNEYVVYNTSQIKMKYLCKVEMKY